ncbi:MAG: hypothetical protein R3C01_11590 [Planctomycetaceae bacterium]
MSAPRALKCPSCDGPLEIPEGRGMFYCQFCGTPVTVPREQIDWHDAGSSQSTSSASSSMPQGIKPVVAIPDKLRVEEFGDELTISWSWRSPILFFMVPFCLFWNGLLIVWYSIALFGNGPEGGMRFVFLLFPLIHVAVGLGLIYFVAALFLNRTTVSVNRDNLRLTHGPLPAPGNRVVSVDEMKQMYVRHVTNHSSKGGTTHTYPLSVLLRSGERIELLKQNTDVDLSRSLEQLIEKHLRIRDEPVPGELLD